MSHSPFKVSPPKPGPASAEESPAPMPGQGIVQSQRSGQPLATPAEVDARVHGHSAEIPWPPAGGADDQHKPMKFGK